jgi:hypothetical protein
MNRKSWLPDNCRRRERRTQEKSRKDRTQANIIEDKRAVPAKRHRYSATSDNADFTVKAEGVIRSSKTPDEALFKKSVVFGKRSSRTLRYSMRGANESFTSPISTQFSCKRGSGQKKGKSMRYRKQKTRKQECDRVLSTNEIAEGKQLPNNNLH